MRLAIEEMGDPRAVERVSFASIIFAAGVQMHTNNAEANTFLAQHAALLKINALHRSLLFTVLPIRWHREAQ